MDKLSLYHDVCKQCGSLQHPNPNTPVDSLSSVAWAILFDHTIPLEDTALVYLHVGNRIGIAHRGIKGYTPTPAVVGENVDGEWVVNWFNERILQHSYADAQRIILSTMRRS